MDALSLAVQTDDTEKLKELTENIPDTLDLNKLYDDRTLLSWACCRCCYASVKILLGIGADVTIAGSDGRLPLDYVCGSDNRNVDILKILHLLLQFNADINGRDSMGKTALFYACEADDAETLQFLIENGCDVNVETVCGDSPMKIACKNTEFWFYWHGHRPSSDVRLDPSHYPPVKMVKMLLLSNVDRSEATFLPTAVQFGYYDLVTELLDLGMDVNLLDDSKRTPLGCACSTAKVSASMVKLLLQYGADVNKAGGWKKQKPIILAYVHNSIDKVRLLLSYGAFVTSEEMTELVSLTLSKSILENPEVVGPNSKELMSWRLLSSCGFRPCMQGRLLTKCQQLRLCSSYKLISPWINDLFYPVQTLKDCCRVCIRGILKPCKDSNVESLPLPRLIKRYLQFAEF